MNYVCSLRDLVFIFVLRR